jgi:condensin complex subunit 2
MEEISTSFCFICLLHLANERGLKIDAAEDRILDDDDGGDGEEPENNEKERVGDIWSLNVYRDPTAVI